MCPCQWEVFDQNELGEPVHFVVNRHRTGIGRLDQTICGQQNVPKQTKRTRLDISYYFDPFGMHSLLIST